MSWDAAPTGRRGRQQTYSDAAIQTCLSMKVLFGMALRQTTGFVESLLRLVGLDWAVPDFSTLSRRQKTLAVNIPYRCAKDPLHLLIDSTGIKVEGEGEWYARKHGGPKRRVWRKIHLGIDEETLEVRAVEITGNHIGPSRQISFRNRLPGYGCAGVTRLAQPDPGVRADQQCHCRRSLRHPKLPRCSR
jgi:hypothetical protein